MTAPAGGACCEACWHLWTLHGPDGCQVADRLTLAACPCEHTAPEPDTPDLSAAGPHSPERTAKVADTLAECARVLNYATLGDAPGLACPADAYALLGALAAGTGRLPQLLGQVGAFLAGQAAGGGLADDAGGDVVRLTASASAALAAASAHAECLTGELLAAQQCISGLSVREDER